MNTRFHIKLIIIFIMIILLCSCFNISFARQAPGIDASTAPQDAVTEGTSSSGTVSGTIDPVTNPDYYAPTEGNSTKLSSIGKTILAVINVVGIVVAVVSLGIIGLRYMFGSVEERANYKETMVPYIIGLVMLGGITSIVNIIYNIATNIGK